MSKDTNVKDAYQEKLHAQLEKLEARITLLKAKAKQASANSKIKARDQIRKAKKQYEKAEAKITEFQSIRDDTWQDVQGGIDEEMQDLSEAVEKAIQQFNS